VGRAGSDCCSHHSRAQPQHRLGSLEGDRLGRMVRRRSWGVVSVLGLVEVSLGVFGASDAAALDDARSCGPEGAEHASSGTASSVGAWRRWPTVAKPSGAVSLTTPGTTSLSSTPSKPPQTCPPGQVAKGTGCVAAPKAPPPPSPCGPGTQNDPNCSKGPPREAPPPPVSCPAGTYSSKPGIKGCTLCPAGRFAPKPGASVCDRCPAGTVASNPGATSCVACTKGTRPNADATRCEL
jgi:hypothetical protein